MGWPRPRMGQYTSVVLPTLAAALRRAAGGRSMQHRSACTGCKGTLVARRRAPRRWCNLELGALVHTAGSSATVTEPIGPSSRAHVGHTLGTRRWHNTDVVGTGASAGASTTRPDVIALSSTFFAAGFLAPFFLVAVLGAPPASSKPAPCSWPP